MFRFELHISGMEVKKMMEEEQEKESEVGEIGMGVVSMFYWELVGSGVKEMDTSLL